MSTHDQKMTKTVSEARLNALRRALPRAKADALLVLGLTNVRYLTGFTGSNAMLLVTAADAVLFTDGRYQVQAGQEVTAAQVVVGRGPLTRSLTGTMKRRRLRRLAFEPSRASFEFYRSLRAALPGRRLIPLAGAVEKLRAIKSPEEAALIRAAVRLNSQVFEAAIATLRPGQSELEVARSIDALMWRQGAEKAAFETIVASGPRSALPHARPSHHPLRKEEFIIIDQGVILDGYSSDMTRTVVLGGMDGPHRELYGAVLEAQLAAIAAVRPGIRAWEVHRAARMVLRKHGLEKAFVHSTGHGVGLEVHEAPRLAPGQRTRLAPGMVITIEPGAYKEGWGGVRIEDMVLVTPSGCEVLTPTSKDLRVL